MKSYPVILRDYFINHCQDPHQDSLQLQHEVEGVLLNFNFIHPFDMLSHGPTKQKKPEKWAPKLFGP